MSSNSPGKNSAFCSRRSCRPRSAYVSTAKTPTGLLAAGGQNTDLVVTEPVNLILRDVTCSVILKEAAKIPVP